MKKLFFILFSILLVSLVSCEPPYTDEQFEHVIDTTDNNMLKFTVEDVTFRMIFVEGGTFKMGATPEQKNTVFDDEKPVHEVTVSSFYIAETEVTQALWEKVMWFTPTQYGSKWQDKYGLGPNYPAYYISWDDCQEFIVKLNELTGRHFRMPTEAEWEYAARGGNKTKGYQYSGSNSASEVGRYDASKSGVVAQRKHNELGIYDMSGNVYEFCSDYYGPYTEEAQVDPTGAALGSNRVIRGGSWDDYERDCRVARRQSARTDYSWNDRGLRLVLAAADSCTITTIANDNKMGSITGGGKYHIGDTIALKATPKSGYKFVRWGDDNNDNPRTITVTHNETFTAYFESTEEKVSGIHNGHTFVDLGLPSGIFWATCNVGAESATNTGYQLAWAETSPKEEYEADSYKYGTGGQWMDKYCHSSKSGTPDYIYTLESIDDAATVNWGGSWRTPTKDELEELQDECTWTWTTRSGINGYEVKGKNGNTIFLPAAGENFSSNVSSLGTHGYYWSSELSTSTSYAYYAHQLGFNASDVYMSTSAYRHRGASVRPVCPPSVGKSYYQITVLSNDESMGTVSGGGTYEANTTAELIATPNAGYMFVNWSDDNTSNPRRMTVNQDLILTANFSPLMYTVYVGVNDETMGSVTGGGTFAINTITSLYAIPYEGYKFVKWNDENTDNPKTLTIVRDEYLTAYFEQSGPPAGNEQGHEYIDLGLPSGTLWASVNIGALQPEGYGDYYAWAETTSGKSTYAITNYTYASGTATTYNKYCTSSAYGTVDEKEILESTDDAARAKWGGRWRVPTAEEQRELITQCSWRWTTRNGIHGYSVVGPNGNAIFIPAAGYVNGTSVKEVGTKGHYWSWRAFAPNDTSNIAAAYTMEFENGIQQPAIAERYIGLPIRAVINDNPAEDILHTVSAGSNSTFMGTVSGSGKYVKDYTVTLTPLPVIDYMFLSWSDGSTDNPRALKVTNNFTLMANFGDAGTKMGYPYVDLGLPSGTLWATYNAGATTPYEYGTYKNHLNWKGWEWPTKEDYEELKKYCTSEQILEGRKYIGPNGNSILFPYAGYCYQHRTEPTHVGTDAYYWTSSMYATGAYNYDNEGYFFSPKTNQIVILYTFDYACPVRYVYRPQ